MRAAWVPIEVLVRWGPPRGGSDPFRAASFFWWAAIRRNNDPQRGGAVAIADRMLHERAATGGNVTKRFCVLGGLMGLACASSAAAAEEPILVPATRAPEPEISIPVA